MEKELFQKLYYQQKPHGNFNKFLYHVEKQFRGIDLSGKLILEIGCGIGMISQWIALLKKAEQIVAIDEYEGVGEDLNNYDIFSTIINKNSLGITLMKMDFFRNDFESRYFDIVVANYALHHIIRTGKYISNDVESKNQWINLFSEIRRVLKKDGMLILKETTRLNLWRFLPLRFKYIDWDIHPTKKEFKFSIEQSGFRGITLRNAVNYKLRYLSNLLENNPAFSFFVNPDFYLLANN